HGSAPYQNGMIGTHETGDGVGVQPPRKAMHEWVHQPGAAYPNVPSPFVRPPWHTRNVADQRTPGAPRRARFLPWLAGIGGGFALASAAGILALYLTGFDLICKQQILCTVGDDKGWASQVHVTWEGEPSRSFTVAWRTATSDNPRIVEYRRAGDRSW